MFNKKGPERNDIIIPGVSNLSLLPIIGYGPANGFVIGTAISATNLLGSRENTQLSSALVSISLTTKKTDFIMCAIRYLSAGQYLVYPRRCKIAVFCATHIRPGNLRTEFNFEF